MFAGNRSRRRRGLALLAIAAALSLVVTACGDDEGATTTSAEPLDKVTIQMSWIIDGAVGSWLYGIEHGIFAEHGIEVELIPGRGSGFSMQQINEGGVRFAQSHLLPYLVSRAQADSPSMAVSTVVAAGTVGILLSEPAATLADLSGRRIAVAPFSSIRQILPMMLELAGLPGDSVILEPTEALSFALVFDGHVDGMEAHRGGNLATGLVEAEENDKDVYYLNLTDFGFKGYEVLLASDTQIAEDPDLVRRLVAALVESTEAALAADPEEIADLVLAVSPELRREVVLVQWAQISELAGAGPLDPAVIETNLGYLRDGMGIEHSLRAEDLYTDEYLPAG